MRAFLKLLILGLFSIPVLAQDSTLILLQNKIDPILYRIESETNSEARFGLIFDMIVEGLDAQPIYMITVARELHTIAEAKKDPICEILSWSFIGQANRLTGNYAKALECHYRAVELAEKLQNKSVLSHTYNQLGHIYKDREENEKAIQIYQTAKAYSSKSPFESVKIYPLMNIGAVYLNAAKLDSSLHYSNEALRLFQKKQKEKRLIAYTLVNIAGAYSLMNNKEEADRYYRSANEVSKNDPDLRYKQIAYVSMAEHLKRYNEIDSCLFYAKKGIATIDKTVFSYFNAKPAKIISDIYENVNSDSAIKYMKIYRTANEVLNSTRLAQQLQMMSFEAEQHKKEIELAEAAYWQKIRTNILIGGLLVFGFFLLLMYRSNKQKQLANAELLRQKETLQQTLVKLQSTQKLLIQSEKMASLGELTAGIAHEIQNPLNFVNNFSEVNTELIDELEQEANNGNLNEIKALAKDIKENEQKIVHHGKRADAIVKGMLQHSRSSSGVKEPTDINALADEYLRLAYHGLRAKDKSFNATMKTDFDETIGNINIIPQDIGRVVLNLITNAFYAVTEKKKQSGDNYEPTVTISTKKTGDKVLISVKDNGSGIPQKALDKIFQPFFTTKPSGQGTGLGLSLSYDIIRSHGGELKVQTKEGEFAEFIVLLPQG